MAAYSTPGSYVIETPLSTLISGANGISAAAFFGESDRGPATTTLVQDWKSYTTMFGDLRSDSDLGYAVYHYFANGGRSAYVRRVYGAGSLAASAGNITYQPSTGASATLFSAVAVSPGAWGNSVAVTVQRGNTAPSVADNTRGTFHVIVSVDNVEVERWLDLTLNPNASRFAGSVINTFSKLIRIHDLDDPAVDATTDYTSSDTLSGGFDDPVADSDYTTALGDLDDIDGILIINAVGQTSNQVVTAVVNKAVERGDSFAIIDPVIGDLSDITSVVGNYSVNSGYGAIYAPALEMVDPAKTGSAARRTTYPGGAVAGLYVRTEVERSVAKAPAGYASEIRGALGLHTPINDAQLGALYDGVNGPQVNSFKAIPGAGVVVWGARSLNKANPDKFINVRRTLNYIKYHLKDITRFAVFESNDAHLWNRLNLVVSSFLGDLLASGGLKGDSANEAFYILCDGSNNTAATIDQGIVNVEVGVALQYPAEFIVVTLSQWTGGANAAAATVSEI